LRVCPTSKRVIGGEPGGVGEGRKKGKSLSKPKKRLKKKDLPGQGGSPVRAEPRRK